MTTDHLKRNNNIRRSASGNPGALHLYNEVILFFRLIHGECIEEMKSLISENIKVDMILCDLPYGTTACEWGDVLPSPTLTHRGGGLPAQEPYRIQVTQANSAKSCGSVYVLS